MSSVRIQNWESRQKNLLKEGGFYLFQKVDCVWESSKEKRRHIWPWEQQKGVKLE